ncbi:arginine decarboxylase [Sphingobacterium kitahiroshimense]|uniref:arginine decarboxylase n=1 Tax=Sphingobacterium kitahiroshimense TaxID=470446 RepID=UPI003209FDD3
MKEKLLIHQEVNLPNAFDIKDFKLFYRDIDLFRLSKKQGTPLRFTYLPSILEKIDEMKSNFNKAIRKASYQGTYTYYYCTKSSHFQHIIKKALQADIGIEISSAYDIDLIQSLIEDGHVKKGTKIICNGYKTSDYQRGIMSLIKQNHCAVTPMVDSPSELIYYCNNINSNTSQNVGIRVNLSFLSAYPKESRFGLSPEDIITCYQRDIKHNQQITFTTLHFFNENGLSSDDQYWDVLEAIVRFYCQLKRLNPHLTTLDIGGGMPFQSTANDNFDIPYLVRRIVSTILGICQQECVPEPDIVTEFGKYTVAEATTTIFKIQEKKQGEKINWGIIDGSFITHLPDTWAIQQEYPVFAVNNLQEENRPFILGGLTCDSADVYPNVKEHKTVMLPHSDQEQFVAFMHTGAYQEALSGFGGVNHCLIPSPKHIIIDQGDNDELEFTTFSEKQTSDQLLQILGYR